MEEQNTPTQKSSQICIAWNNLNYSVASLTSKRKSILNGLNGSVAFHSLTGLMGASGAGKSTLLNCLSNVNVGSNVGTDSQLLVNRSQFENGPLKLCYIEQNVTEFIEPQLTVRQIFEYAFRFKNNQTNKVSMDKHIHQTMHQLLLPESILDRRFGQCSTGEQKRVAIATELMNTEEQPALLAIDEPTTGLDSAAAFEVVSCLQSLARSHPMAIVASIHVPNSETLQLFDQLYVLARGGVCIYSGPPGCIRETLVEQIHYEVSPNQPPIEALIALANHTTVHSAVRHLAQYTARNEQFNLTSHQATLVSRSFDSTRQHKGFSFSNLLTNIRRQSYITFAAHYRTQAISLFIYLINYLIIATLFSSEKATASGCFPLSPNSTAKPTSCIENLQDENLLMENSNFIAYTLTLHGLIIIISSTLTFSSSINTFKHEHRNEWYSFTVFYHSTQLVSLFELLLFTGFISILSYFLAFQHAADNYALNPTRFTAYLFSTFLCCLYIQSLGQALGSLLVNYTQFASVTSLIFYTSISMFNGFFVNTEAFPLVDWISSLVSFKFISKLLLTTLYGIGRCNWKTEGAFLLKLYNADREKMMFYVVAVLVNIAIVRFCTFLYLYLKYSAFPVPLCTSRRGAQAVLESDVETTVELGASYDNEMTEIEMISEITKVNDSFWKDKTIIAWTNLSLFASSSRLTNSSLNTSRLLLNNLNGSFRFGSLIGLMGTSGAGKTSLLQTLNGQCSQRVSPSATFYLSRHCPIFSCFISADVGDHLVDELTAKQMLVYASRLKNAKESIDHEENALKILAELDITDTAETRVARCSGGERKRLALALELTAVTKRPNFICIDEPTSGLDSSSALTLTQCLRNLTRLHPEITIVTSIHQPTTDILALFDQLYVLARGGVCIYSGLPSQIEAHLEETTELHQKSTEIFPIESLIKYSCADCTIDSTVQRLVSKTNQQHQFNKNSADFFTAPLGIRPNRVRFSLAHLQILLSRNLTCILSSLWWQYAACYTTYLVYITALTFFVDPRMIEASGCISFDADTGDSCSHQTEDSLLLFRNTIYLFYLANFYLFFVQAQASLEFYRDFSRFKVEHRNGWYSTGVYYLAKSILEILPLIPLNLLYVYIANYYATIQPHFYSQVVLLITVAAIAIQGQAHLFTILCYGNIRLHIILSIVVFLFSIILADLYLIYGGMHYAYQLLSTLAIPRFVLEIMLLIVYGFGRCGEREIQAVLFQMRLTDADWSTSWIGIVGNLLLYRVLALWTLVREAN